MRDTVYLTFPCFPPIVKSGLGTKPFLVYLWVFFKEVREKDFTCKSVVSFKAFKALCHVDPCAFWSKRSVWMFTFTRYRAIITDSGFTAKRPFTIDWDEKFSLFERITLFLFLRMIKTDNFFEVSKLVLNESMATNRCKCLRTSYL